MAQEGLLFEPVSNEREGGGGIQQLFQSPPGPLLKSCFGSLARYGTHQETMSGRLEQAYLPSDSRLEWPGEGLLFELDLNKWRGGGQNVGTIRVTPWAIIYVIPGALGQIWHQCESLSYAAEYFYQIC